MNEKISVLAKGLKEEEKRDRLTLAPKRRLVDAMELSELSLSLKEAVNEQILTPIKEGSSDNRKYK